MTFVGGASLREERVWEATGVDGEECGKIGRTNAGFTSFQRWFSRGLEEAHVSRETHSGKCSAPGGGESRQRHTWSREGSGGHLFCQLWFRRVSTQSLIYSAPPVKDDKIFLSYLLFACLF